MLYQIATLLLDVIGGLLTGACLLRLYMQWQRVPFSNPVGALVFALTDWFIMPLRRLIPPTGQWDISSLVGGLLVQQVQYGLLWLIAGGAISGAVVPLLAAFGQACAAVRAAGGRFGPVAPGVAGAAADRHDRAGPLAGSGVDGGLAGLSLDRGHAALLLQPMYGHRLLGRKGAWLTLCDSFP